jgi:hypothetical protein
LAIVTCILWAAVALRPPPTAAETDAPDPGRPPPGSCKDGAQALNTDSNAVAVAVAVAVAIRAPRTTR